MFEMRHWVDEFFFSRKMFVLFISSKTLKSTNIRQISNDFCDHFLTLSSRHPIVSLKFYKIYSQHQNQLECSHFEV